MRHIHTLLVVLPYDAWSCQSLQLSWSYVYISEMDLLHVHPTTHPSINFELKVFLKESTLQLQGQPTNNVGYKISN